jgi:hypothetical protein
MCDSNNLVLNMMLPAGRLKSVPKRTTRPKATHTKDIHTLSIKIKPKRSILFKVKLTVTHNRFSIKNNNFFMWTVHKFPTPPGLSVDLPNKMVDDIFHMTMMVTAQFSMIKKDANTMTTITAMSFNFNMIVMGH